MDKQVDDGANSNLRRRRRVRDTEEEEGGDVMVPVQEDERLLAQHQEDRVDELKTLRKHRQQQPVLGITGQGGQSFAAASVQSESTDLSQHHGEHDPGAVDREGREQEVPYAESCREMEWLTVSHQSLDREDDEDVGDGHLQNGNQVGTKI